jgi:hypothetical protein
MSNGRSDGVGRRWDLLPEVGSTSAARALVGSACRDLEMDEEACEDAQLVVNELVANVVDHAGTRFELTVARMGRGCGSRFGTSTGVHRRVHGLWTCGHLGGGSVWAVLPFSGRAPSALYPR